MYTVEELREDVKSLYGADVKVFGQPCHLRDEVGELEIDILDIINNLEQYEADVPMELFEECRDCTDIGVVLQDNGYVWDWDCDKADNSYNWSSPVNHDFSYHIFKATDGSVYITFMVHRYGDVRGNYTDDVLLHFNNDYEFYDVLFDCNKYITVELDDDDYYVDIDVFSDTFRVTQRSTDREFNICAYDMNELKEEIRKEVA